MRTLYLIRGLPGSGKSALANWIWQSGVVFESDKFWYDDKGNYNFDINRLHEAHMWCKQSVEEAMLENIKSNGQYCNELVVSNTLTTEKEIVPYLELASKYDYKVISLIVENRHGNKSIHNVPDETMDKMRNRFSIKL